LRTARGWRLYTFPRWYLSQSLLAVDLFTVDSSHPAGFDKNPQRLRRCSETCIANRHGSGKVRSHDVTWLTQCLGRWPMVAADTV